MLALTALRTPAMTCHAKVPSLSLTSPQVVLVEAVLDAGETDTAADVAVPAIVVAEVEQAVDHRRQDADVAVEVADDAGAVEQAPSISASSSQARFQPSFSFDAEATEVVTADQVEIEADLVVDVGWHRRCRARRHHRRMEKSRFVSSTIIAPPSTPTYQALSHSNSRRSQRGRSERSHNGQLPHRDIPFHMRSEKELPEHIMRGSVAVQDYKCSSCCPKVAQFSALSVTGARRMPISRSARGLASRSGSAPRQPGIRCRPWYLPTDRQSRTADCAPPSRRRSAPPVRGECPFPRAVKATDDLAGGAVQQAHPVHWRYKPPAALAEASQPSVVPAQSPVPPAATR